MPKHRPHIGLPGELTSFVGRTDELEAIVERLGSVRVVTLSGSWGAGKTRLALRAAWSANETGHFPDGVWWVDLARLKEWQPGLISFEHESGEPGQVGAKSRIHYQMGKREVDMIETITARNLPDELSGTYEAKGIWNKIENRFAESGDNKTHWIMDNEFRCTGFMKIMAFLMPGMFKRQSLTYMKYFKEFAEKA